MRKSITPVEFIDKWRGVSLTERSASQSHFVDLCWMVGHDTPVDMDPYGDTFTFERGAEKSTGGDGWADVWYRGHFAWEYKGRHKDLGEAYQQVLKYRDSLENPPLLIVSDMDKIIVRTSFTNTPTQTHIINLEDLKNPEKLNILRAAFFNPDALKPGMSVEVVTEEAAKSFSALADRLRARGYEPERVARFLIRLLFCLFAEDVDLLPKRIIADLVTASHHHPQTFTNMLRDLFAKMEVGGWFGRDEIPYVDGRLFEGELTLQLEPEEMRILQSVSTLNWGALSPAILGTLFERSLDPNKRSQLGAHYTSEADIKLLVEPVIIQPLRRRWAVVREELISLAEQWKEAIVLSRNKKVPHLTTNRKKLENALRGKVNQFANEIASVRVLDPACGSGNFLYVSLVELLNFQKEVASLSGDLDLGNFYPTVTPAQLIGIEINEYAHVLAQVTVQIGYLQWLYTHGFGFPPEPILKPLDNILHMDAVLRYENGQPCEPEWPEADYIVGNPPFLGDKKMKAELGEEYVNDLRKLYNGRVPGGADLCCYWFEKSRGMIEEGQIERAGLLATQGIRGGKNRKVLEQIKESGDIFWAWSDRDWVLDGATVHVSMVGFDGGDEPDRELDGQPVGVINADLTASAADLTSAVLLRENAGIAFVGDQKGGKFDIRPDVAARMMAEPINVNGRPNSDVIKPWYNGRDLVNRPRGLYIIDFGVDMPEAVAAQYQAPYEYLRKIVKAKREDVHSEAKSTATWWLHQRPRPEMRNAIAGLDRFIATPRVSKYRLFVWLPVGTILDSAAVAIALDDDYSLGVLQSRYHEIWARRKGTQLREAESGSRYSQTMTFQTFPFPWSLRREPKDDPRVQRIADAARELVRLRDNYLNPPGISASDLRNRTLTNLYNENPVWLKNAHAVLDRAVSDAYEWPADISDEEVLERLIALNKERAK